jgi:uncharacterized protein (TIGR02246 family)
MTARNPEDLHALLETAFNSRDLDRLMALYEEDATLNVPPEGKLVTGREAIRASAEGVFALAPRFRSEVVGKLEGPNTAVTHAHWSLAGTGGGGETVEMSGRGTMVSRRQADGSWRIVLDNPLSPA